MKTLPALKLKGIKIDWLHDKTEAPLMQAMAINQLRKIYKGAKRYGYVLLSGNEGILPSGCYYLLELRTDLKNGKGIQNALIAFKEYGDHIRGYAIFTNSDQLKTTEGD